MHQIPSACELMGPFVALTLRRLSQDFADPHAPVSPMYHSEAETRSLFMCLLLPAMSSLVTLAFLLPVELEVSVS